MIRLLLIDDHPALRAGLTAVLRAEPGMVPLGTAGSAAEAWPALTRMRPDVVLLDYHLPDEDGLVLCLKIKRAVPAPRVIIYSAYADAGLTIPAMLAGADGIVNKGAPAAELFDAIRRVSRGEPVLPPRSPELLATACERLEEEDLPILSMTLDGTQPAAIAEVLGLESSAIARRLDRMIERLQVTVPGARAAL